MVSWKYTYGLGEKRTKTNRGGEGKKAWLETESTHELEEKGTKTGRGGEGKNLVGN